MNKLRERFCKDASEEAQLDRTKGYSVLTVAVKLPNGAIEVITNTNYIRAKLDYYLAAYDHEFKLRTNTVIQIVGYMLVKGEEWDD